ncbi:MAG: hypothetical protein OEX22_04490 [Cyclobacteriaceae bacterium]|nr:hypothetical protein [Cyclobacteriaceae bacterium]
MKTKKLLVFALCLVASVAFSQTDPFEGRPTSPGADVASDKENVPVKKESFTSKLERYKSEGFKVAVVLSSGPVTTKPQPVQTGSTSLIKQITLEGNLPSMENDIKPLVENFTATMNETFSTDVFEIVDMKTIPYKEVKIGKVDDWGSTKYKMVITYSASPEYDYNLSAGKYSASLSINLNVTGLEYVNEKGAVKIKYPIRVGNLGFYKSEAYETETDPAFKTIEELHTVVNPPLGAALLTELQKEQDGEMPKFLAKRKK